MKYWGLIVLLILAAGYVALGVYGKYRTIKDEYQREKKSQTPPPEA